MLTDTLVVRATVRDRSHAIHLVVTMERARDALPSIAMHVHAFYATSSPEIHKIEVIVALSLHLIIYCQLPICPIEVVAGYGQSEWIGQVLHHNTTTLRIHVDASDTIDAGVREAQLASGRIDGQGIGQVNVGTLQLHFAFRSIQIRALYFRSFPIPVRPIYLASLRIHRYSSRIDQILVDNHRSDVWIVEVRHFDCILCGISPVETA